MILTVTMNPSVDIAYLLHDFQLDEVNRVSNVKKTAGGKGLNVTRVLHQLGAPVEATGVIGGVLGKYVQEELKKQLIAHCFYSIKEETRNSIAILDGKRQTEILEQGPNLTMEEIEGFLKLFEEKIQKVSTLTISGSLCRGLPVDFYSTLLKKAKKSHCAILMDTSGDALYSTLSSKEKPTLIKPNESELADLLGISKENITSASLKNILLHPLFEGIEWIIVSRGPKGAFAKHHDEFYKVTIPKVNAVNPVGSGDATLAGAAFAIDRKMPVKDVLSYAMTCGILNVLEMETGHIDVASIDKYYSKISVEKLT